eukprot:TRINITY_DN57681_c0_g1_i1.p1 TRINITY_DN57681_c0_g1~~TRINITY_DN57681_c0_g1_i1.p1  ORF type:complete len:235 (-),score=15.96 TRINITY_DN57681_c0_g1_i1:138-842(-)
MPLSSLATSLFVDAPCGDVGGDVSSHRHGHVEWFGSEHNGGMDLSAEFPRTRAGGLTRSLTSMLAGPATGNSASRNARHVAFSSFVFEAGIHFHAPIDDARATSTYSPDYHTPTVDSPWSAQQALKPGTGYWCSKGRHQDDDVVTWTGRMKRRRPATGIKISWAYAPGEVRVRTSPDLIHWDTAADWHKPAKDDVSFEEDIFFDRQRNVFQVKVEMRKPQPWNYFGINQATFAM